MPKIKLERVISCSSEDPDHVSNNLLNGETKKKWKSLNVGEASVTVILQLEKSCLISGIDIGNENSSFVEVLVGRSSSQEQDYKILLAASSFMTPMEARNLSNSNRVRMFTYDNLSSSVRDEKWDRIKVVCTQPFNKHVKYGLSFITLHTSQEQKTEPESTSFGKFTLRPESPNVLSAGSLFAKRKELVEDKPESTKTVAEAIKSHEKPKKCKPLDVKTPKDKTLSEKEERSRNRKALFYNSDEEEPNEKIDKAVEKLKAESEKKKPKTDKTPAKKKTENKTSDSPKPSSSTKKDNSNDSSSNFKRKVNTTPKLPNKKQKLARKPFSELLKNVVFTISGIVNPERGNLRTMALSMGAKYKPDWDNSCTHLICAFANTPKFNQVRGKGKIITKSWIKDCFDQRKRLPWRRYALDRNDIGKPESEDEIEELVDEPEENNTPETPEEINLETYNQKEVTKTNVHKDISGSDTDDEIEKILAKQKETATKTNNNDQEEDNKEEEEKKEKVDKKEKEDKEEKEDNKKEEDIKEKTKQKESIICDDDEGNSTEEEELKKNPAEVENIPRIFESEIFYVDDALDTEEKNKLQRLIKAFDGVVLTSLRNIVDFVITNEDSVELIKERSSDAKCINANWIYECHDVLKRVPYEKFEL